MDYNPKFPQKQTRKKPRPGKPRRGQPARRGAFATASADISIFPKAQRLYRTGAICKNAFGFCSLSDSVR